MEQDYILPKEYIENDVSDNGLDINGNDLDLQTINNFVDTDDTGLFNMIDEDEENKILPANASKALNSEVSTSGQLGNVNSSPVGDSKIKNNSEPVIPTQKNNSVDYVQSKEEINDIVNGIDLKIGELENLLKNSGAENVNSVNNQNIENNNTQVVNTVKKTIQELNDLRELKKHYETINNASTVSTEDIAKNIFNETGNVVFDNFTPNLKPTNPKKEKATERAIETEKAMGGNPSVEIAPGIGEVVIDRDTQENVISAIEDHGGVSEAMTDSVVNQIKNNNFSSSTPTIENFTNTSNETFIENIADTNYDIIKNTAESNIMLNKISKQLDNIFNSLNKSFGGLNNSLKDIKTSQQNNYYQTLNKTESNEFGTSTANYKNEIKDIPDVRGDKPLEEDFPKNFNTDLLFSNYRP